MNDTTRPDVTARRIKYDLCDACDMPRADAHHSPTYKMHRSAYDIPAHRFVQPTMTLALTSTERFAVLQALGTRKSSLSALVSADPDAPLSWTQQLAAIDAVIARIGYVEP